MAIPAPMRLAQALRLASRAGGARRRAFRLCCGFEPLHLATFLKARLNDRYADDSVEIGTGLFGDLEGNLGRAAKAGGQGAFVFLEWGDLDPRLGLRAAGGWGPAAQSDVLAQVEASCARLGPVIAALGEALPAVIVPPTLDPAPIDHARPPQAGPVELGLAATLAAFLARTAALPGVRVLSPVAIDALCPATDRHDARQELHAGFPYRLEHADRLAALAMDALLPAPPMKGLITDLDHTLWRGILGDDGPEGVAWSLEAKAQVHALYQQAVASLAETGVLVAVASKNDPGPVEAALGRPDLLVKPGHLFPVEAGWGPKSEAVERILAAWNISADSVVFIDDSPLELAEVASRHPGITTLAFPADDPAEVIAVLRRLRSLFGKEAILEEDRLRLDSLRASAQARREGVAEASPDFLAGLEARIAIETVGAGNRRAFELVNKTNQFNLNGARFTETEWQALAGRPGAFLAAVSYADRFGPLGQVGVIAGTREGGACSVDVWVLSCRAFSRRIEHALLDRIFRHMQVNDIAFDFRATGRNGPMRDFLAGLAGEEPADSGSVRLSRRSFLERCPPLHCQVTDPWTTSEPA